MRYLILIFALCLTACSRVANLPAPSIKKTPAPEFKLQNLSGDFVSCDEFKGKWVVLNIWATWCPPCTREIPDFIDLQEKLRKKNVQFVGISVDDGGIDVVKSFVQRNNINYPILLTDMDTIRTLFGSIDAIPTTFIISPDWYLINKHTGLLTYEALKNEILGRMSAYKK